MSRGITLDYRYALPIVSEEELFSLEPFVEEVHRMIHHQTTYQPYLGWVDLPYTYDKEEFERIKYIAKKIQQDSDALIVIGIGGSYLGAKAALESLHHHFYNQLPPSRRKGPEIYFAGQHMSESYVKDLFDLLEGKDISVNVISKSGTTTEPAIAFRLFRTYMEKKYGKKEAAKRIYATTDRLKGALKALADEEGYETFVVPDNIGGRYSVLTPVGLLPIAVSGLDIDEMMKGAKDARTDLLHPRLHQNNAYQYATLRHLLYEKGKKIEMLVHYEPRLQSFSEWWKQLFGESEGKNGKGLFPASAKFSTDLHSIGQYIQEGPRHLFETVLHIQEIKEDIVVDKTATNTDGLDYLAGKSLSFINEKSFEGAVKAHQDGGVPNLVLHIPQLNEYFFGYLVYFFEKACAASSLLLGVHPFNQPGVEAYKQNMFSLLGKNNGN